MLEGILKGLFQWIYGMFLDLISYVANALLGILGTDLTFFEESVPVVKDLYGIMIAVGWGLLIGNCVFQAMKSMFSGLGFEGESPIVLLCRTGIFGFLLIFARQVCAIGLNIGKQVIDLIGIPKNITITMPDEGYFSGVGSAWILVIIIGFILGFQLIKLFLEIGERYAIVAVLTLMCPVGLAMGGSKSTKDICAGYIRTFASMILMMVTNVLFLKLILSGLATMPSGIVVLPWCVLLVGLVRVARKVDNLISKIGLSPAITGDSLGRGAGGMVAMMAARTIISSAARGRGNNRAGNTRAGNPRNGVPPGGGTQVNNGGSASQTHNNMGGTDVGGASNQTGGTNSSSRYASNSTNRTGSSASSQANQSTRSSQSSRFGGSNAAANTQSSQSVRSGSSAYGDSMSSGTSSSNSSSNVHFAAGSTRVNTNRFGTQGRPTASATGAKPTPSSSTNKTVKATTTPTAANKQATMRKDAKIGMAQNQALKKGQQQQPFNKAQQKSGQNAVNKPGVKMTPMEKSGVRFGKTGSVQPGTLKMTPKNKVSLPTIGKDSATTPVDRSEPTPTPDNGGDSDG